jgi:acetolactate synthase-1/2/3 large subunit
MALESVPYPADIAIKRLAGYEHLVLVGSKAPVGFFAYPNMPSKHYPEHASVTVLCRPEQDALAALAAVAEELSAPAAAIPDPGPRPEAARGAPSPEGLALTVAALMPGGDDHRG